MLRGVNVGGKNRLPMARLVSIAGNAGCRNAATYIQSGNLLFQSSEQDLAEVIGELQKGVQNEIGKPIEIVVRSKGALANVVTHNPFARMDANSGGVHVLFLSRSPDPEQAAALDPLRSPGDSFHLAGTEVYLHLKNGFADTRLTNAYFDSKFGVVSTARNLTTVVATLAALEKMVADHTID